MLLYKEVYDNDIEVYNLIMAEWNRQEHGLELIASENRPSLAVLEAQASGHTLKYAEGYPGARYYGGCNIIDQTEQLAINRACQLFNCKYANVQPHSGAQANMAVQFALAKMGDTIMGMSLNSGGHLTHGAKPTFSGKAFHSVQYEVDPETFLIDYDKIEDMIVKHRPKIFIAGASAYPREINFKRLREAVDKANARIATSIMQDDLLLESDIPDWIERAHCYFMVDMAHIAGLVAAGLHQSPIPYADVITSTTHKTLRGPRGGLILTNSEELNTKINKAVFPGIQGGPLENIIAAKAVCFGEALKPEFKEYMTQTVKNCKALAQELIDNEVTILTQGTDNHLILIDLRDTDINGAELEKRLESINITTNKNAIPFDTRSKNITSGLRIGTAAVTSRGLVEKDMKILGTIIATCIHTNEAMFKSLQEELKEHVQDLCSKYPLYR